MRNVQLENVHTRILISKIIMISWWKIEWMDHDMKYMKRAENIYFGNRYLVSFNFPNRFIDIYVQ